MKYYEILYIVNPNLEQPRLDEIKKEVAGEVKKLLSAAIINHRIFGKKRLAYQVDKHKYGIYILLHVEAQDNSQLVELNTFFKLNKTVIRHLVIRLDRRPEEDLSPEADSFIAGARKETVTKLAPVEDTTPKPEDSAPAEDTTSESEESAPAEDTTSEPEDSVPVEPDSTEEPEAQKKPATEPDEQPDKEKTKDKS